MKNEVRTHIHTHSLSALVSYQVLLTQPVELLEFLRHEQLSASHCTSDFAKD